MGILFFLFLVLVLGFLRIYFSEKKEKRKNKTNRPSCDGKNSKKRADWVRNCERRERDQI